MKTALSSIKRKLKVVARKKIKYVDMVSLNEYAYSVLNGLKIHYSVESLRKDITESYREEMNKKMYEMAELCHYFAHYDTAEKVEKLINQYAPILKNLYQKKIRFITNGRKVAVSNERDSLISF